MEKLLQLMPSAKRLNRQLTGWGQYPRQSCQAVRPERYAELQAILPTCIARGQGRSYGDAALNQDNVVILTERLNRILAFDKDKGVITAEAGTTLAEILQVIVPAGWFLPVTPGTTFATLGGCVAADVHGKNHHRDGSFGKYIIAFEIITADHKKFLCTPKEHVDLFWATIGGMGLTGIIGTVVLKLMPIQNPYMQVHHHAAQDLDQAFLYLSDPAFDDQYSVAWIDALARGKKMGRSIMMTGHHAASDDLPVNIKPVVRATPALTLPFHLPNWFLNHYSVKLFNGYYFRRHRHHNVSFIQTYQSYFYPLDKIGAWNRLYGKKGFVQYQCVLPTKTAFEGIKQLLSILNRHHSTAFLAVLKRFGESNPGLLSFPMPGYTLALDIPFREAQTLNLLRQMDDCVLTQEGRVYLAKDACLSPDYFRHMYPQFSQWLNIKKRYDPQNIFSSSLSRRLHIGNPHGT